MAAHGQASLWEGCRWGGSRGLPARLEEAGSHRWLQVFRLCTGSAGFQLSPVSPNTSFGGCISREDLVKREEVKKKKKRQVL